MPKRKNDGPKPKNAYTEIASASLRGDEKALQELIPRARAEGTLNDNLLRIALQNASKRGKPAAARVLLEEGAPTDLTGDKGSPALSWAVTQPQTKGHEEVTKLLLSEDYKHCPADPEWKDENGRTIFMAAAWRGHNTALKLLLDFGAKYNVQDLDGRTVLHNLANDKRCRWNTDTLKIILERDINVDAKDNRSRTALHWAVITGKPNMVALLVTRPAFGTPDVNAVERRGKTALHMACRARPAMPSIVDMLLRHGANPLLTSDGHWTCLHNTAKNQFLEEIVHLILENDPTLINATTSTGMTPLHVAAQFGNAFAVRKLLEHPEVKLNLKDAFYMTPMLRAAQEPFTEIVEMLSPLNELNTHRVSPEARNASDRFEATIVDFRSNTADRPILVNKRSINEVLYGKEDDGSPVVTTNVQTIKRKAKTRPRFRWIHLPANNMAWAEALISKAFVESGGSDVKGLKAAERAFSQQHRGEQYHSSFMKPYCEREVRGTQENVSGNLTPNAPSRTNLSVQEARALHAESSPERAHAGERRNHRQDQWRRSQGETLARISGSPGPAPSPRSDVRPPDADLRPSGSDVPSGSRTPVQASPPERLLPASNSPRPSRRNRRQRTTSGLGIQSSETQNAEDDTRPLQATRTLSLPISEFSAKSGDSRAVPPSLAGSNISFFMPYLHFETDDARREMSAVIRSSAPKGPDELKRPRHRARSHVRNNHWSRDEMLIHAYLHSTTGLHLRRTLDQYGLQGIDTADRDSDQVVGRYCASKNKECKIFMVDQLWMWILGPSLIITAFPQRWEQPKNDPLNVLDGVIEDINAKAGKPVESVQDLALVITARCCGSFDRHKPGDEDYQFLDMFESSIGTVNNAETKLYNQFYQASNTVHNWLRANANSRDRRNYTVMTPITRRYPEVVDQFLDIGEETGLLKEIKDIQDELGMISRVLAQQKTVLEPMCHALMDDLRSLRYHNKWVQVVKKKTDAQKRIIDDDLAELDRMRRLATSIEHSLINLLDLKQKQSNAFEARFARDQAAGTVRQGQVVLIFTVVTIVFLPVSFMAQFFTINISQFRRDDSNNLPLGYVSQYIFGVGLGISVFLIIAVFSFNPVSALLRGLNLLEKRDSKRQSEFSVAVSEERRGSLAQETLKIGRLGTEEKGRFATEEKSVRSGISSVVQPRLSVGMGRVGGQLGEGIGAAGVGARSLGSNDRIGINGGIRMASTSPVSFRGGRHPWTGDVERG